MPLPAGTAEDIGSKLVGKKQKAQKEPLTLPEGNQRNLLLKGHSQHLSMQEFVVADREDPSKCWLPGVPHGLGGPARIG